MARRVAELHAGNAAFSPTGECRSTLRPSYRQKMKSILPGDDARIDAGGKLAFAMHSDAAAYCGTPLLRILRNHTDTSSNSRGSGNLVTPLTSRDLPNVKHPPACGGSTAENHPLQWGTQAPPNVECRAMSPFEGGGMPERAEGMTGDVSHSVLPRRPWLSFHA